MSKIDDLIKRKSALYCKLYEINREIEKATGFSEQVINTAYDYHYSNRTEWGTGDLAEVTLERETTYELIQCYFEYNDPRNDTGDDLTANLLGKALSDYHARAILLGDEE